MGQFSVEKSALPGSVLSGNQHHCVKPSGTPPNGTAYVPERMEKRPVMMLERLGVHCVSIFMFRSWVPSLAKRVDAWRGRASRDAAAIRSDLAVAEVVGQNEDDVGLSVLS
jgi:hypothetical protein